MKKVLLSIVMLVAMVSIALPSAARNKEDDALVKELSGGLPVYMGNNLTWRTFDIDDHGTMIIGLLSNTMPALADITDELRDDFKKTLSGPNSGYVGLSKHLGRKMVINVYNTANELCVTETISPDAQAE